MHIHVHLKNDTGDSPQYIQHKITQSAIGLLPTTPSEADPATVLATAFAARKQAPPFTSIDATTLPPSHISSARR